MKPPMISHNLRIAHRQQKSCVLDFFTGQVFNKLKFCIKISGFRLWLPTRVSYEDFLLSGSRNLLSNKKGFLSALDFNTAPALKQSKPVKGHELQPCGEKLCPVSSCCRNFPMYDLLLKITVYDLFYARSMRGGYTPKLNRTMSNLKLIK